MKRTKLILPPMIVMEFFGASSKKVQNRTTKVLAAQFDKPLYAENQETLAMVKKDGEELDGIVIKIQNGDNSLIPRREVLIKQLSENMMVNAFSTMKIARGNSEILKNCGYQITGQPKIKPVFSEPKNLQSKGSKVYGAIVAKVQSLKLNGIIYLFECAEVLPDGTTGAWKSISWKYVNYTFTDLKPGVTYQIRVGAKNNVGVVLYSSTIKCVSGIGE